MDASPPRSDKVQVALVSALASGLLAAAKFVIALMTGSLALLSDALHSLIDLGATLLTLAAVKIGDKPADANHPYGHGKFESMAALAETALLLVLAGGVAVEAVQRLLAGGSTVEMVWLAIGVLVVEIAVNFWRARALQKAAVEHKSQALEADALHFASDLYGSIAVIIGLLLVSVGQAWGDAAAAFAVALLITGLALRLGKRVFDALTDATPEGMADKVEAAVSAVGGVIEVTRTRVRPVGAQTFVDLGVAVPRTLPLDRLSALKADLTAAIATAIGPADVTISAEPRALDGETVLDRVGVIARNRGLAVHHVTVHAVGETTAVALDLEVDGQMSLARAHDIATDLENAIEAELGSDVEVETHIEPLETSRIAGTPTDEATRAGVAELLTFLAGEIGPIHDCHDVRVRDTDRGLVVLFHLQVDGRLKVSEVHTMVDELERALKRAEPRIVRAIGHAEPRKR